MCKCTQIYTPKRGERKKDLKNILKFMKMLQKKCKITQSRSLTKLRTVTKILIAKAFIFKILKMTKQAPPLRHPKKSDIHTHNYTSTTAFSSVRVDQEEGDSACKYRGRELVTDNSIPSENMLRNQSEIRTSPKKGKPR